MRPLLLVRNKMGDENSIANETFTHAVSVFESAWTWCVKNDARFDNEIIHDLVGRIVAAHNREAKGVSDGTHSDRPITTELRGLIAKIDAHNSTNVSWLVEDSLNDIDSVHENLEIEYSELVEQVEELKDLEARSIELPKDGFGKPIRIGDVIECGTLFGGESPFEVRVMQLDEVGWELLGHFGDRYYPNNTYHHQPDTWERIIEDAVSVHGNGFNPCWTDERDALVARCHVLAGDAS